MADIGQLFALYRLLHLYEMSEAFKAVQSTIQKILCDDNALGIFSLEQQCSTLALDFICANAQRIFSNVDKIAPQVADLTVDEMKRLFHCDHVFECSEDTIWRFIRRWVEQHFPRSHFAVDGSLSYFTLAGSGSSSSASVVSGSTDGASRKRIRNEDESSGPLHEFVVREAVQSCLRLSQLSDEILYNELFLARLIGLEMIAVVMCAKRRRPCQMRKEFRPRIAFPPKPLTPIVIWSPTSFRRSIRWTVDYNSIRTVNATLPFVFASFTFTVHIKAHEKWKGHFRIFSTSRPSWSCRFCGRV